MAQQKGKPAPAQQPVTPAVLQQMIQNQDAARSFAVTGDAPEALGGAQVNPLASPGPLPPPPAPAPPLRPEDSELPARPSYQPPWMPGQPVQQPTQGEPQPAGSPVPGSALPGQPGGEVVNVEQELRQAQERIQRLETDMRRQGEERQRAEAEARIEALPEEERPAARLEHERMLRYQSELKLEAHQLRQQYPTAVRIMDLLGADPDLSIEIEPGTYRATVTRLEPLIQAMVDERLTADRASLQEEATRQWGVRPAPDQAVPPPPDDPDILTYKQARQRVMQRPGDPAMMQQLIAAGDRLRQRGIDKVPIG